jgi:hypothetical protein
MTLSLFLHRTSPVPPAHPHKETPMRGKTLQLILTLAIGLAIAPAILHADVPKSYEGHWEGSVIFKPAANEVAIAVDIFHNSSGGWQGTMTLPLSGVNGKPLKSVQVSGQQIVIQFQGVSAVHVYTGTLQPDGDTIKGEHGPDDKAPFELHRKARPSAAAPVVRALADGPADLRAAFTEDDDKVRLVVFVSPDCLGCKMGTRLVEKYVLDALASPDLRVYVVWEPILKNDSFSAAQLAAANISDPRVSQFWIGDQSLSNAFKPLFGLVAEPAYDLYMLYPRHAKWLATPPAPAYYMHNMDGNLLPADRAFDGAELAKKVKEQIAQK